MQMRAAVLCFQPGFLLLLVLDQGWSKCLGTLSPKWETRCSCRNYLGNEQADERALSVCVTLSFKELNKYIFFQENELREVVPMAVLRF